MSQISSWNFEQDPQVLAEKSRALNVARQQASTQRQHWEQGLRIKQYQLDGLNTTAQIEQEKANGKRPLLEAERIKTQANREKIAQARLGLQSAQLGTSIARDSYQALQGERSIRQKLLQQKLKGLSLQCEQLRASSEAQKQSISLELGGINLPTLPMIGS